MRVEPCDVQVHALPADERAVVFSQFTAILDICAEALRAGGVASCRIDGSCTAANRAQTLRDFGREVAS